MGVNSLPKSVTRQRRGGNLNPGPSAPESSTLITRLPSHLQQTAKQTRLNTGKTNNQPPVFASRVANPQESPPGISRFQETPGEPIVELGTGITILYAVLAESLFRLSSSQGLISKLLTVISSGRLG